MKIGTKSVLFGAHQFLLHPLLIAIGWWQEYGFGRVEIGYRMMLVPAVYNYDLVREPLYASLFDPRLWLAFVVHDIGYLGKPNMDGPEGETHPEFGAQLMRCLFGDAWGDLCLLHSRYYAKRLNRPVSALCAADKRVFLLEPVWLYLPRVWATGELAEYIAVARRRAESEMVIYGDHLNATERAAFSAGEALGWHRGVKSYMRRWIDEHRGGKADTWTHNRHEDTA